MKETLRVTAQRVRLLVRQVLDEDNAEFETLHVTSNDVP